VRPFNETVRIAVNLPDRVAAELETVDRGDLVGITALTDPYQPVEATYRLTRHILRLFADRGQPCLLLTKSQMVLEDLVLLQRINAQSLAIVMFTLLTVDPYMAARLEEKAPAPSLRLDAIRELKRAGIPVGVALLPVIPYVNDTDLLLSATLRAIVEAGVDFVVWDYLHIPTERHRARIAEMLQRIGSYPPNYYRDLYRSSLTAAPGASATAPLPNEIYRVERDRELLARCDALNLPARPPHQLYAGRLRPENEAALLLKHTAFRDAIQGRARIAELNRGLAELIYQGAADDAALRDSPLYPTLRDILQRDKRSEIRE
jgi:DNA repair photolyase